jgi:two-component system response regulator RegA
MKPDKVLLVDDEVEFVETLAERMRARGLDVQIAHCGKEALGKVSGNSFDAVVLDLAMPGMDGIETLRLLRLADPELQIMLLTGQGTIEAAVEATKLGAMDVFEKPTDIDVLMEKIKESRARKVMLAEEKSREDIGDILKRRGW